MGQRKRRSLFRLLIKWPAIILLFLVTLSIIQVVIFRYINPPFTPLMIYWWVKGEGIDYRWRPLSMISPSLQQAVMASEDQLFRTHHGFDFDQIHRAIKENMRTGKLRGASTITMQVSKNLYLWQGQSWVRKGLEAYYTVLLEFIWPKWRIMEVYLNIVEWGRGIYGAEAAARRYFNCPASKLTRPQCAILAAVLPNPRKWSPLRPTPYIIERQATILDQIDGFRPLRKPP
jgi:monofunctional biosynthetic peptidoglycan transglycosylase